MTDYSGLVERLREDYDCPGPDVLEHIREAAAAIEAQQRELDEARAELAKVKESAAWHKRNAKFFSAALTHMTKERDALRDKILAHNLGCIQACGERGKDHCSPYVDRGRKCPDCPEDDLIPLPPSAAPAASEPKPYRLGYCPQCGRFQEHGQDRHYCAEAGAGQKFPPRFYVHCTAHGTFPNHTSCPTCAGLQQSDAHARYWGCKCGRDDCPYCGASAAPSPAQPEGGK